jgi:hypothetical protein
MAHRNRAEQRAYKARKDPKGLAKPTRFHAVKTTLELEDELVEQDMLDEIDEFFAEYQEPDDELIEVVERYTNYRYEE